jgi:hypothetical protein
MHVQGAARGRIGGQRPSGGVRHGTGADVPRHAHHDAMVRRQNMNKIRVLEF